MLNKLYNYFVSLLWQTTITRYLDEVEFGAAVSVVDGEAASAARRHCKG